MPCVAHRFAYPTQSPRTRLNGAPGKAIDREKQIKRWRREKKLWLIAQLNPEWRDLAAEWYVKQVSAGVAKAQGPSTAVLADVVGEHPRSG